ncbi:MAG: molybdenum cofactor guanylyltransferase MobA [Acetobacteraceae bacterium]
MTTDETGTVGLILAGGLARRMGGGHKMLRTVGGETVLDRLIRHLRPQVKALVLNINGDAGRFTGFGLPLAPDDLTGHPGPLAGVLAGLDWTARADPAARWLVTVPGDAPFIPGDLVQRLHAERKKQRADLAVAASGGRIHPVIGLWPVAIAAALRHALVDQDIRKIDRFTAGYRCAVAEWPATPRDPFFNVNTPEDLVEAEHLAGAQMR